MRWAGQRSQTTTRKPGHHLPPSTILANRPTALLAPPMESGNAIRQSPQREERQQSNLGVRGNLAAHAVVLLDAMARKLAAAAATRAPGQASDARRNPAPSTRNNGTDACFPMFGKGKRSLRTLAIRTSPPSTTWLSRLWLARRYAPMKRSAVACRNRWRKPTLDTTSSAATPLLAKTGLSK